jgi:hypothetical protein
MIEPAQTRPRQTIPALAERAPRLSINRLDLQIVNQSPPEAAAPKRHSASPAAETLDSFDRQLGWRIDLG